MRKGEVALLRRLTFEPLFTTRPPEVGSTSPWTLLAAMMLDTRCRTLARRRAPRSWSQLALSIGLDGVGHVFPPYFIPSETKINAARYQDMLRSYYDPKAKTFCCADTVFQQDGAPSHTSRTTRVLLGEMFRETLVWPALSPDLSPNDYALWSLWESLVAQENPTDATTLRAAIIKTHEKITGDQIKRMILHFTRRLRLCFAADGGYFAVSLR